MHTEHVTHEPAVDTDGGLVRVRADLGYDGTGFHGWAVQPGLRTVAGVLAGAVATVLRLPVDQVVARLVVAGRTDAGVHATGQVAHLDVPHAALDGAGGADALVRRVRGLLPDDVRLASLVPAPAGFDARFAALRRHYRYRVCDDPAGPDPLRRHDTLAHARRGPLDVEAMTAAAQGLLGLQDFAAFCRRREGATTVRRLLRYDWSREADGTVVAHVGADAFCHSMVRALVGALLPVGEGRRPAGWPRDVLLAAHRDPAVAVVPAHGLTLVGVDYPDDAGLAARVREARARRG
ncbi:tRNA pseudouridine(38-40) synthase TruA [Aquipuribacter sp. SD81]|uniref:tRNA pseudouridine(38-40) synthase TruA n=1 Tax=Aquipuribacter sp. SD81 TaxID=3127703 RepID=UPI00301B3740